MKDPEAVANAMRAIEQHSSVPVSVKCRIGVDDNDSYPELVRFIRRVRDGSGVRHFIIHARKASGRPAAAPTLAPWAAEPCTPTQAFLQGLDPHQNRTIPPLRHQWVWALSRDFPDCQFTLNGGVTGPHEAASILRQEHEGRRLHGVMIGRAAYNSPWQTLSCADKLVYGESENPMANRRQLLREYCAYADSIQGRWKSEGEVQASAGGGSPITSASYLAVRPASVPLSSQHPNVRALVRPILNLFAGERGNRMWKQLLDKEIKTARTLSELVDRQALQGLHIRHRLKRLIARPAASVRGS